MFTVGSAVKMFGGKLSKLIQEKGGKIALTQNEIEEWAKKEKIPFKLEVNDKKEIIITERK